MQEHIGRTLGSYQIVEQIGIGGMATVYKAYQPSMDRFVAIKILPGQLTQDAGFVGRFTQEARTLARLEHPHILPVHDYGEQEGITYLVMRYVDAGTLKELIASEGEMELSSVVRLMGQMGGALDYAHTQGVIHRDMKPSNVLIDQMGNTFLTDFGIAKLVAETAQFTATGAIIGTPAYMSPEQGMGQPADLRSDIYSLGVVLYEMVTGRVPFEAETPLAVMLKQINDPLPLPRHIRPGVPEGVEQVIMKATAKEPADRYQSARLMVDALDEAVVTRPVTIAPPPTGADDATVILAGASTPPPPAETLPPATHTPPPAGPVSAPPSPPVDSAPPAPAGDTAPQPLPSDPSPPPHIETVAPPSVEAAEPTRRRFPWLAIAGAAFLLVALISAGLLIVPNLIDGEPAPTEVSQAQVTLALDEKPATEEPPVDSQPPAVASPTGPAQVESAPNWTSYGNGNFILALARQEEALWAGGESGLVRWNLNDGSYTDYGIADGLASGYIEDLLVDTAGDLWIATDAGINRFDGQTMTTYDEADGLDASHIQALFLDDTGGLWAGSRGGERGLNYYDGRAWGAPPIPELPVDYRTVQALAGNEEQGLFVGLDDQGLAHFDGEAWQLHTVADGLPEGELLDLMLTADALWASFDSALARFDLETGAIETVPQANIQAMHEAADGAHWFGGMGRALRLDPGTGDWAEFETAPGPIPSWMVTSFEEDEDRLLLGTYGGGLAGYDGSQWETWTTDAGLGGNWIEAIRQGPDGTIWFTHPGSGLSRYDPEFNAWQVFGYDEGATDWPALPDTDSEGHLWVGEYGELLGYDGQVWQTLAPAQLADVEIYAIEIEPGDVQWLSTDRGLIRHDPAGDEWTTFTGSDHPIIDDIWSMLATSDGSLWLGGDEGVVRYDGATWSTPEAVGSAPRYVSDLAEAPDGSLWLAADGELAHLAGGQWSYYEWPFEGWLEYVTVGPDGIVWGGYDGLGRYDPASDDWQMFTPADGLVHETVSAIHVTPEGVVWVGTEGGVSRIGLGE